MTDYSAPLLQTFKLLKEAENLALQRRYDAAIHKLTSVRAEAMLCEFALADVRDAALDAGKRDNQYAIDVGP